MHKIKFFGLGGQGVVTAARILVHAVSIYEDKFGKTVPAYGHERRGAPVFADVMIDRRDILLNSFVYEPDMVVVFAQSVLDHGVPIAKGIHKDTILVMNTGDEALLEQLKKEHIFKEIYYVDATRVALEQTGREIPNSAILGALARTGVVGIDSALSSLKEFFKSHGGKNAAAAQTAYERTKKW
ncbi:MAG: 2-oxoacid:acceptor oxidoreductase family protein [Candidatus Aminicenantes bacterium]|nr:2-oxoacid:acceptor oxidoreductase family protein [Candidatus Aminicenantes bacterium]